MKRFQAGTGLVAVESRSPIVPVKVDLTQPGIFNRSAFRSQAPRLLARNSSEERQPAPQGREASWPG